MPQQGPGAPAYPPIPVDPDLEAKKAAARAYALSSTTGGYSKNKKKAAAAGAAKQQKSKKAAAKRSSSSSSRSRTDSEDAAARKEAAASLLGASRMPPRPPCHAPRVQAQMQVQPQQVQPQQHWPGYGGYGLPPQQQQEAQPQELTQPQQNSGSSSNFDLLVSTASNQPHSQQQQQQRQQQPNTPPAKRPGYGIGSSPGPLGLTVAAPTVGAELAAARTAGGTGMNAVAADFNAAIEGDDEYAKFVRSLCQDPLLGPDDDLASLISRGANGLSVANADDDDDDGGSYQLTSDEEQDDDDDEDDELAAMDDDDEEDDNSAVTDERRNRKKGSRGKSASTPSSPGKPKGGIPGGSLFAAVTGRVSTSASKSKAKAKAKKSSKASATTTPSTPPTKSNNNTPHSLNLYSEGAKSPTFGHNLNIMAELEAELSLLLEEDMDAAVSTLLGGHVGGPPSLGVGGGGASSAAGSAAGGVMGSNAAQSGGTGAATASGISASISKASDASSQPVGDKAVPDNANPAPSTPAREEGTEEAISEPAAPPTPKATKAQLPTSAQIIELRNLMSDHYQLLLQQSVLAVRSANYQRHMRSDYYSDNMRQSIASDVDAAAALVSAKAGVTATATANNDSEKSQTSRGDGPVLRPADFFFGGESADDLAEILDGAVGMLQDLDENRKDGIRNALQLEFTRRHTRQPKKTGNLPSLPTPGKDSAGAGEDSSSSNHSNEENHVGPRRLTRSAFQQTLKAREGGVVPQGQESNHSWSHTSDLPIATSFDVKGLSKLESSFASIDSSVDAAAAQRSYNAAAAVALSRLTDYNVLTEEDNGDACEILLRRAGAHYDKKMIPGRPGLIDHMTYPKELLGPKFTPPADSYQEEQMRRNRNQFTSGEDNLILRGVSLYGEKEWLMISDRFLPDRPVSAISQRYSRLCLLLYRAAGINIGPNGDLDPPPKHPNGAEDLDLEAISAIPRVEAPARFSVHRWSLDEDITILKAVPLMGYLWAEIGNRLIRHRDRGHLRKRYQVLERRVKAAVKRESKTTKGFIKPKPAAPKPPARPPAPAARPKPEPKKTAAKPTATSRSIIPPLPEKKKKQAAKPIPPRPLPSATKTAPAGAVPPYPYAPQYPYYYPPVAGGGGAPPSSQQPGGKGGYPAYPYPYPYYYPQGYVPPEGYDYNGMKTTAGSKTALVAPSTTSAGSSKVPVLVSGKPSTTTASVYSKPQPKSGGLRHPGAPSAAQASDGKTSAQRKKTQGISPSKVLGADTPIVPQHDLHSQGDESTRLGFESILEDQEWSQMSRVKQLIDEGESIRPRSMANQMERLPSLRAAEDTDSMLNNVDNGGETLPNVSEGDTTGKKKMSFSGSIMANVMERANSRSAAAAAASSSRGSHPGAAGAGAGGGGKKRKSSTLERQHSLERSNQHLQGTPTKALQPSQYSLGPLTPMAYTAGDLPPIAETPGEASIGSLLASLKSPAKPSPAKSPGRMAGDATLMGMMRSPGGGMINLDGFDVSNFSTSGGDGLSRLATVTGLTSQGIFGTNSLMDTDMEAIGALTALSNPPTPHVSAPNTPQKPIGGAPRRIDTTSGGDSGATSLFARAVGHLADKKKDSPPKKKKRRKKR